MAAEPLSVRRFYRVINPDAEDYSRVGMWVNVVDKDDDPDVATHLILQFADDKCVAFSKDELELVRGT